MKSVKTNIENAQREMERNGELEPIPEISAAEN
jgi:hypothetical protein